MLNHIQNLRIFPKLCQRNRPTHRGKKAGRRRVHYISTLVTNISFSKPPNESSGACSSNLRSLQVKSDSLANFCCINTQSIRNKTVEFCDFVLSKNLDIIAVCETWLRADDSVTICDLTPRGYFFQHVPRLHKSGGGVGLLFRSTLSVTEI